MARAKRMLGYDVFFQTGTDEHGQKMLEYADRAGKDPKAYADEVAPAIKPCGTLCTFPTTVLSAPQIPIITPLLTLSGRKL